MQIAVVVPAKGVSQRLENKNLYKINGKTLVERTCEKLLNSKIIDRVYLDTESDAVKLHCAHLQPKGLSIIDRPAELATNHTGANELMMYALHSIAECDLLLQTFPTSPLISIETIDKTIEQFVTSHGGYDSFFTVTKIQEYFWNEQNKPINFDPIELPNSFNLKPYFMETHGLYGIYAKDLIVNKSRVGKKPMLIEINKLESFDVDDYQDLEIVEHIIKSQESSI